MDSRIRFIVSSGSDDQHARGFATFEAAEDHARSLSETVFSRQGIITSRIGVWLATYKDGTLVKCDVDAVAKTMR